MYQRAGMVPHSDDLLFVISKEFGQIYIQKRINGHLFFFINISIYFVASQTNFCITYLIATVQKELRSTEIPITKWSNPLLISTDFLKYPFRHSFRTGKKIQL